MTDRPLHHRAFVVTVVWTLALLVLGSVVHATESSLACPDWPTCFGTMVPEMEGGVFWEHLHRLVAGGLLLMFGLATWLARRDAPQRPALFRWSLAGLALLLVQSVFGGLTVLMRLPDAVSSTHLALAFLFLALAAALAAATVPARGHRKPAPEGLRRTLSSGGRLLAALVFVQSVLGGAVRHTDAGMACGDGLLCNGGLLPPAWNTLVALQLAHRILALVVAVAVVAFALRVLGARPPSHVSRAAAAALTVVVAQVVVGFASVMTVLSVPAVSLHTLLAAVLLALCVLLAVHGAEAGDPGPRPRAAGAMAA